MSRLFTHTKTCKEEDPQGQEQRDQRSLAVGNGKQPTKSCRKKTKTQEKLLSAVFALLPAKVISKCQDEKECQDEAIPTHPFLLSVMQYYRLAGPLENPRPIQDST